MSKFTEEFTKMPEKALLEGINRMDEIKREGYPTGVTIPTIWKGMTCPGDKNVCKKDDECNCRSDHVTCPAGWTLAGLYTTLTDTKGNHSFNVKAWLVTSEINFNEETKIISWGMGGAAKDDETTERFRCESNSADNIGKATSAHRKKSVKLLHSGCLNAFNLSDETEDDPKSYFTPDTLWTGHCFTDRHGIVTAVGTRPFTPKGQKDVKTWKLGSHEDRKKYFFASFESSDSTSEH